MLKHVKRKRNILAYFKKYELKRVDIFLQHIKFINLFKLFFFKQSVSLGVLNKLTFKGLIKVLKFENSDKILLKDIHILIKLSNLSSKFFQNIFSVNLLSLINSVLFSTFNLKFHIFFYKFFKFSTFLDISFFQNLDILPVSSLFSNTILFRQLSQILYFYYNLYQYKSYNLVVHSFSKLKPRVFLPYRFRPVFPHYGIFKVLFGRLKFNRLNFRILLRFRKYQYILRKGFFKISFRK